MCCYCSSFTLGDDDFVEGLMTCVNNSYILPYICSIRFFFLSFHHLHYLQIQQGFSAHVVHTGFENVRLVEPHIFSSYCVLPLRDCEARRATHILCPLCTTFERM